MSDWGFFWPIMSGAIPRVETAEDSEVPNPFTTVIKLNRLIEREHIRPELLHQNDSTRRTGAVPDGSISLVPTAFLLGPDYIGRQIRELNVCRK